jgi:hypothetical protein
VSGGTLGRGRGRESVTVSHSKAPKVPPRPWSGRIRPTRGRKTLPEATRRERIVVNNQGNSLFWGRKEENDTNNRC